MVIAIIKKQYLISFGEVLMDNQELNLKSKI